MNIFEYENYVGVLKQKIAENAKIHRYKTSLAEAAGCQPSFLSQVLASKTDLSAEHAIGLSDFWLFSELEREYFIDLVHLARAKNRRLRDHIASRLQDTKRRSRNFSDRFQKDMVTDIHKAEYYSAWYYTAIHILLTVPEFQLPETLAKRIKLPVTKIKEVLIRLEAMGFAEALGKKWISKAAFIHLDKASPLSQLHHQSWRVRSILAFGEAPDETMVYSALYSLSQKDLGKLRNMILEFIDDTRKLVVPSQPEEVVCFSCDLYNV